MSPGMFDGLDKVISFVAALLLVAIPLAAWKIIDVFLYVFNHLQWVGE